MELQDLRCFQHVAAAGSFSRASVQLGLTQPSLTRHIRKLEDELGTQLFYRNGRGVTLTVAGGHLLEGAGDLLADASRLRQAILDQGRHPSGVVAIGMPPSFCAAIGAGVASGFRAAYPGASLRMYEHFSATLLEWVCAARLDLAVLYDVRRMPSLLVTPLFRESLFLVQPVGPRVPEIGSMTRLAEQPLILPCIGSGLRKVIQLAAARDDVGLDVVLEMDSVAAIKQLVEQGAGATILPYGAVHREVSEGRLQAAEIDPSALSATLVLATPALQPVSAATRALCAFLTQQLASFVGRGVLRGETLSSMDTTV